MLGYILTIAGGVLCLIALLGMAGMIGWCMAVSDSADVFGASEFNEVWKEIEPDSVACKPNPPKTILCGEWESIDMAIQRNREVDDAQP